ncbi:MAG: metalloregulator ArsR/SmtB family transcription factor [bacterium]|nr:metalloregulator ArsR/SmtB family transcription factor [bacterium]
MAIMTDQKTVLVMLKALADENRLTLLARLAEQEYNVTQIAQLLAISEPTASHHLTRLREAGLVTLRTLGTQRIYSVNPTGLDRFKQVMQHIETITPETAKQSDNAWIDALPASFSAADRELLAQLTFDGRLIQLPSLRKHPHKLALVMRWLTSLFTPDTDYSEGEVNARLQTVHEDSASLRRYLVDMRYLERDRAGRKYRVCSILPG